MNFKMICPESVSGSGFIDEGCLCNDCNCQKGETKVVSGKRKKFTYKQYVTICMNDRWYSYFCLYLRLQTSRNVRYKPQGDFYVCLYFNSSAKARACCSASSDNYCGMTTRISNGLTSRHRQQKVTATDKSSFVPFQVTTLPNCMPFPIYLPE